MTERLWGRLCRPVDPASLVAFRLTFGLVMLVSTVRFLALGWVDELLVRPTFHFTYEGFGWLRPLPGPWLHAVYAALAALSAAIAVGFFYRLSVALFLVGFTYVQLLDVTYYLNHYYLVSLLALLLLVMPLGRVGSVDAWRQPHRRLAAVPAWALALLRFQVGVVYVFAGLAKLGSDWLLEAQPLNLWLASRTETPGLGPLLAHPWAPHLMSWAGFGFDTTIVLWLLWPRTRPFAYAAVVVFHGLTQWLFPIGMFPSIMAMAALVFLDPSWPRRWLGLAPFVPPPAAATPRPPRPVWLGLTGVYLAWQLLVPLRHRWHGGNVLWDEVGMRWSWKVMVREKNGSVTYHVEDPASGRRWQVSPRRYLTEVQAREFSGQPDLIWQLARTIARDHEQRGHPGVAVRVEALVSLNGRPAALLLDPTVDLTRVADEPSLRTHILPAPTGRPVHLYPL